MKLTVSPSATGLIALIFATAGLSAGAQPSLQTQTLSNGIHLAVVYFPNSTNISLFTFLPLGLASDGADQAQWSHLVEHLVIRSTFPDDLTEVNAETSPDNMRLDFYGHTGNWADGLSHHKRWLLGVPFTDAILAAEKPKVIAECDYTAKNLATHKFALAAWAQCIRHERRHVELKGDVQRAALEEVQRYRDEHLVVPGKITLCSVGGVDPKTFFREAQRQLGSLRPRAKPIPPANAKLKSGRFDLTWDLSAQHLVLSWPIPGFAHGDHAALMTAAQWLNMQFFGDEKLREGTGQVFAGTDLVTPEGNFFYVSASLRPGAAFADMEKRIRAVMDRLTTNSRELPAMSMIGTQLGFSLRQVPDPRMRMFQAPAGMTRGMMEGNAGLMICLNVHRYGAQREPLARKLSEISAAAVQQAVGKHLTEKQGSVMTIHPVKDAGNK